MSGGSKPRSRDFTTTEVADIAMDTAHHSRGGIATALVSALALLFSGVSLYQSVVKQAQLHIYLPDTISYTRDPDGNFEVLVLPVTVANSGARDGIVSTLTATIRNLDSGASKTLAASYFTAQGYFSTKEDVTKSQKRPKTPFAPLSVPGRSAYSGTILFYAKQFSKPRVVAGKGRYELTLSATSDGTEHFGILDQFWTTKIKPLIQRYTLPAVSRYFDGRMLIGHTARLFRDNADSDSN